jgi:hypothetical protein
MPQTHTCRGRENLRSHFQYYCIGLAMARGLGKSNTYRGIVALLACGVDRRGWCTKKNSSHAHTHTQPRSQGSPPLLPNATKTPLKFCSKHEWCLCALCSHTAVRPCVALLQCAAHPPLPPSPCFSATLSPPSQAGTAAAQAHVRCWDARTLALPSTCSHVSSQP